MMSAQPDSAYVRNRSSKVKAVKILAGVLVTMAVFMTGVGVGSGKISFTSSASQANKDLPADLDYESVEKVYDVLRANYDGKLDQTKLLDGMKSGLAKATGDPYTDYLNAKETEEFDNELNGSFTGIGAELGEDADGNLIVIAPIEGFPASKAGLRAQDVIISIDGTSTADMDVDEAVKRIRGKKDTKVTLRVLRNRSEDLNLTITRAEIRLPSTKWELLDGGVGYITISRFSDDTFALMNQAARELKDKGAKSILLDLRNNPGGRLDAAVAVANMWLPEDKTIVQEKRGGVVAETYTSDGGAIFRGLPSAVLINGGSASASEIVAGALRDHGVATTYGEKSFGKGSVQQLVKLRNGDEVKVTVARWYRPNGQNIDKKGIKPDKEVKMSNEDYEQKRDPQKDAAIEFLRK